MLGQGLFALFVLTLWIYCIFDCIRTDESEIQNLPKVIWLLIVIFVPTIGSIAWLLLGRPAGAGFRLQSGSGSSHPSSSPSPTGFAEPTVGQSSDDFQRRRDEALRRYHEDRERELREREEELRRREEEVRRREQGTEPS